MKIIKSLLIIGLLLVGFISNAQKPRYIKTDTYEGVVFPKRWVVTPEMAKHAFIPTDKEIATMEKKIADSIGVLFSDFLKYAAYKGYCDNIVHNVKIFKRQYCGSWYKGDKVIYVDFFLNVPDNWKEVMLISVGTTHCTEFSINYSVNRGKFLKFSTDFSPL